MRKLELNKKYEFTIKAPELDAFDVEFSVLTEKVNYNVKMIKGADDIFELVLPEELQSLPENISYNINVFHKTNRFLIESGDVQLVRPAPPVSVKEEAIQPKFEIAMLSETVEEKVAPEVAPVVTPTKNLLAELTKTNYVNDKVRLALRDLKKV